MRRGAVRRAVRPRQLGEARLPDGTVKPVAKATGLSLPKGSTYDSLRRGGGSPSERDPQAVHSDVREGYVSEEAARRDYPHAFDS